MNGTPLDRLFADMREHTKRTIYDFSVMQHAANTHAKIAARVGRVSRRDRVLYRIRYPWRRDSVESMRGLAWLLRRRGE